ncbi:MAG: hypothetical protein R2939_00860 [Kofleriaceae bacterium]
MSRARGLLFGVLAACASPPASAPSPSPSPQRIVVVGASMSAGFGGTPFATALAEAAPTAVVTSHASVFMFQDAVASGTSQVTEALADEAELVFAIDYLFWDAYNGASPDDRLARVDRGLADLARLRDAGAVVVVGDVPRIVTASPMLIPPDAVPPGDELATINQRIRAWGRGHPRVLVVPFASWTEPLAAGAAVEVGPGEAMPATALMAPDGLHPNALGVWYVLRQVDALMETTLGTPPAQLVFARPAGT